MILKKKVLSILGRRNKQQILKEALRPGPQTTVSAPSISTIPGNRGGCTGAPPTGGTTSTCSAFDSFEGSFNGDGINTGFGDADVSGYHWNDVSTNASIPGNVFSVASGRATVDLSGATSASFRPVWQDERDFTTAWPLPGELQFEFEVENPTASSQNVLFVDTVRTSLLIYPGLSRVELWANTSDIVTGLDLSGLQTCKMRCDGVSTFVKIWPSASTEPSSWTLTVDTSNEVYWEFYFTARASSGAANTKWHFSYMQIWGNDTEIDTCSSSEYIDGSHQEQIIQWNSQHTLPVSDLNRNNLDTTWDRWREYGSSALQFDLQEVYNNGPEDGKDDIRVISGLNDGLDTTMWADDIHQRRYWSFRKPDPSFVINLQSVDSVKITGEMHVRYDNFRHNVVADSHEFDIELHRALDWGTGEPDEPEPPGDLVTTLEVLATRPVPTAAHGEGSVDFDIPFNVPSTDYIQFWWKIADPKYGSIDSPFTHQIVDARWVGSIFPSAPDRAAMTWTVTITDPAPYLTVTQALVPGRAIGFFTESLSLSGGAFVASRTPTYYTDVYFDGIKVNEGEDYTLDSNNGIIPILSLNPEVVQANYVVR